MKSSALPPALSAKFVGTFAYNTVKDRLPQILTKVVDTTYRQRHETVARFGAEGSEELKKITGALSELRYRLATDKPFTKLNGNGEDIKLFNDYLEEQQKLSGNDREPSWFKSAWMYAECFLYRKIAECFENGIHLQNWDPFQFQKEQAFVGSLPAMDVLGKHLLDMLKTHKDFSEEEKQNTVCNLIQICLWGNRCDLSISGGEQHIMDVTHPLDQITSLQSKILVNDMVKAYNVLAQHTATPGGENPKPRRVDFILDNAGLELFGDLCLAEFLLDADLADTVVFYPKVTPWFVSDTTSNDFSWTLEMLRASNLMSLNELGHKWHKRLEDGEFLVKTHHFWTLPHEYFKMESVAPDLHEYLSNSQLLVFKGDLNYRKLTSDLNWPTTTSFSIALRGFAPAPLVALRTLKAPLVVGLQEGQAEEVTLNQGLKAGNSDWMNTGEYAVIQCCNTGN